MLEKLQRLAQELCLDVKDISIFDKIKKEYQRLNLLPTKSTSEKLIENVWKQHRLDRTENINYLTLREDYYFIYNSQGGFEVDMREFIRSFHIQDTERVKEWLLSSINNQGLVITENYENNLAPILSAMGTTDKIDKLQLYTNYVENLQELPKYNWSNLYQATLHHNGDSDVFDSFLEKCINLSWLQLVGFPSISPTTLNIISNLPLSILSLCEAPNVNFSFLFDSNSKINKKCQIMLMSVISDYSIFHQFFDYLESVNDKQLLDKSWEIIFWSYDGGAKIKKLQRRLKRINSNIKLNNRREHSNNA